MVTRLSASDASFYHLENSSTPMYVGTLSILRKPRNGLSYETLPWITAGAILLGALPSWPVLAVGLLYGLGAHGIMTLNDLDVDATLPGRHGRSLVAV